MPGRTTIAAVSGLAAGITLTVAAVDRLSAQDLPELLLWTAVRFFPLAMVMIIALEAARRWITARGEQYRADIEALAEHRRQLAEEVAARSQQWADEFERRSAALREREERLNRHSLTKQEQHDVLMAQLAEARAARAEAVRELEELRADFDVLADQHNALILGEVDERAGQFRPRRSPRPGGGRERRRERGVGATDPPPPMTYIGRQPEGEPEHHSRPAEG